MHDNFVRLYFITIRRSDVSRSSEDRRVMLSGPTPNVQTQNVKVVKRSPLPKGFNSA